MSDPPIRITAINESGLHANLYLIRWPEGAAVIEPAAPPKAFGLGSDTPLSMILATHGHFDHIGQIRSWQNTFPQVPVLLHEAENILLSDPDFNASGLFGQPQTFPSPTSCYRDGQVLKLGDLWQLLIVSTPGHTPGSSCFVLQEISPDNPEDSKPIAFFTGDTLIGFSIGRTDFPLGSAGDMKASLEKILNLARVEKFPESLPVYGGHGPTYTWGQILENNPWLQNLE